jgi:hypothetical protein
MPELLVRKLHDGLSLRRMHIGWSLLLTNLRSLTPEWKMAAESEDDEDAQISDADMEKAIDEMARLLGGEV